MLGLMISLLGSDIFTMVMEFGQDSAVVEDRPSVSSDPSLPTSNSNRDPVSYTHLLVICLNIILLR